MIRPITNSVKKFWKEWNVRGAILLSLSFQAFLIISAPFRKRTANRLVIFLIWSSYLLASYAVGHISSKQSDEDEDADVDQDNDYLPAFWAPFLLVHLGGQDPITAFAVTIGAELNFIFSFLERNESRTFFFSRDAKEAYMIIGAELNFIYEALYTKVIAVHTHKGYIFCALSSCHN